MMMRRLGVWFSHRYKDCHTHHHHTHTLAAIEMDERGPGLPLTHPPAALSRLHLFWAADITHGSRVLIISR